MTRSNAYVSTARARNTDARHFPLPLDGIKVQSVDCDGAEVEKLPVEFLPLASRAQHFALSATHMCIFAL